MSSTFWLKAAGIATVVLMGIMVWGAVFPHAENCKARAAELGRRWPLPADTFVRDKALALLADEGLIGPVPAAPVRPRFEAGFWGCSTESAFSSSGDRSGKHLDFPGPAVLSSFA